MLHPVNLAILALAIVAGLCSAWWLAPVGFIFWVIMVVAIARDPGLHLTFTRQNRQPLAPRYQVRFDRLDRARFSIFNTVEQQGSQAFKRAVMPLQAELDDLVDLAYRLGINISSIDNNFSVQQLTGNFEADIQQIQMKIESGGSPAEIREFESTLKTMKTRQEQLKSVSSILSRYEIQLTGTNAAIDSIVTGISRLLGQPPHLASKHIEDFRKLIADEKMEISQFEEELGKAPLL
jgi:hypothetical protein